MQNKIDINKSNYESFVIDYLDGKLNAIELACFIAFLENNPDIKSELDDLENVTLDPEKIVYKPKGEIKKKELISTDGINENNYEDCFIGHYEKELTYSQNNSLKLFLKNNPELNDEFELHKKIKLVPDYKVVFPNKDSLKRKSRVLPYWFSSAAAVVIILTSFWFFTKNSGVSTHNNFVSIQPIESNVNNIQSLAISNINMKLTDRHINSNDLYDISTSNIEVEVLKMSIISRKSSQLQLATELSEYARTIPHKTKLFDNNTNSTNIEQSVIAKKEKKKRLFAAIFKKQLNKIGSSIKVNREKKNTTSPDPTYVKVLDRGILVFNTITGSETYTSKIYNFNGELTSYQIEGKEVYLRKGSSTNSAN